MSSNENGQVRRVRCAIYTRKSSEEGLEQEFNSLDAQRDAAENYIASQKGQGWEVLPDRYDDGGFSGGNTERPALRRLMSDVEAGKIDCVVVYKVDRLSRSLMDFSRLLEVFEKYHVSFVSVTQHFNTTNSMGRLTLNILLSFAQFEREIISERTRDKIAGARRRGKWVGGRPPLGYDIANSPNGGNAHLVVNEQEAEQVLEIFRLYLETGSLIAAIEEIDRRGWTMKRWVTKKGRAIGGKPFTSSGLLRMLTNVIYLGKVTYGKEVHEGEHGAIIDQATFDEVQQKLTRNRHNGGANVRNRHGALLKGLVRCTSCNCAMVHHFTTKKRKRAGRESSTHYRYYVCLNAQKRGWKNCPAASVPAGDLEEFVVQQVRELRRDHQLLEEVVTRTTEQARQREAELHAQLAAVKRRVGNLTERLGEVSASPHDPNAVARLADLQEQLREAEREATELRVELDTLRDATADPGDVAEALTSFDPAWATLSPMEKWRLMQLLIESVEYDGPDESVTVTFRPTGLRGLVDQMGGEAEPPDETVDAGEEVAA